MALGLFDNGCGKGKGNIATGSWQRWRARWWQQIIGEWMGFCLQESEDVEWSCSEEAWRKPGNVQDLGCSLDACALSHQIATTAWKSSVLSISSLGERCGGEGSKVWLLPSFLSVWKGEETLFKASVSVFLKLLLDSFQLNLNWKVLQVPDGAGICNREIRKA